MTIKKNFRRKTRAIILEPDSEEEENDSPSTGANCDSSRRKQIQEGIKDRGLPYIYCNL